MSSGWGGARRGAGRKRHSKNPSRRVPAARARHKSERLETAAKAKLPARKWLECHEDAILEDLIGSGVLMVPEEGVVFGRRFPGRGLPRPYLWRRPPRGTAILAHSEDSRRPRQRQGGHGAQSFSHCVRSLDSSHDSKTRRIKTAASSNVNGFGGGAVLSFEWRASTPADAQLLAD